MVIVGQIEFSRLRRLLLSSSTIVSPLAPFSLNGGTRTRPIAVCRRNHPFFNGLLDALSQNDHNRVIPRPAQFLALFVKENGAPIVLPVQ